MIDHLVEVRLPQPDNFLKIIETLTRIGVSSGEKKLVQTCHILHKRGKYYIVHYRELFILDGHDRELSEDDITRRNGIVNLLAEWGLCEIVDKTKTENASLSKVKVIPFSQKSQYTLKQNYTIGKKSRS